jgi:hypothetical protein
MSVIADELHNTRVIVVGKRYLSCHISTCSAGVAGRTPVRKYTLVIPWMAITYGCKLEEVTWRVRRVLIALIRAAKLS